jgi:uncharacterized Zn finger protein (UPF0148 family)
MTPPPCADHAESELSCPVCTAQRRQFYRAMGAQFEDAESTSAALARVERERDQLRAAYQQDAEVIADLKARLAAKPRPTPHLDAVKAERDLARAELASALQELDALRTVRDQEELPDKEDW